MRINLTDLRNALRATRSRSPVAGWVNLRRETVGNGEHHVLRVDACDSTAQAAFPAHAEDETRDEGDWATCVDHPRRRSAGSRSRRVHQHADERGAERRGTRDLAGRQPHRAPAYGVAQILRTMP